MREAGAPLAGERSGHIFIGGDDYLGFDDGLFAAAKLVEYLSHTDRPLSAIIADFPHYVTSPEIKAPCADDKKYDVTMRVTEELQKLFPGRVNDINGARVDFGDGWGLVRASSNMPELVLVFEAATKERLLEIRALFREILGRHQEISPRWENDFQGTT
jgi:phosphomannomutase/phosphoglucomutase